VIDAAPEVVDRCVGVLQLRPSVDDERTMSFAAARSNGGRPTRIDDAGGGSRTVGRNGCGAGEGRIERRNWFGTVTPGSPPWS
jgi:hypothetical protein